MAKPRSKVLRRVSSKPTAEIQKVLDMQAQKKRYNSWSQEDSSWEPDLLCTAATGVACTAENGCGNPSCENYSILFDPYYSPPQYSLIIRGIPIDSTGLPSEVDPDLCYVVTNDAQTLPVDDVAPVSQFEAIVSFPTHELFAKARSSRVLSCDNLLYTARPLPFVSRTLLERLQKMEEYDEMIDSVDAFAKDEGAEEEEEEDPMVGAALIPSLRRSDFTKPIGLSSFNGFRVNPQEAQRLRAILSS